MNEEQRYLFDTFGYLVVPGVLAAAQLDELRATLKQPTEQFASADQKVIPLRWSRVWRFSPHASSWSGNYFNPDDFRDYPDMDDRKMAVLEPPSARYPGRPTRPRPLRNDRPWNLGAPSNCPFGCPSRTDGHTTSVPRP